MKCTMKENGNVNKTVRYCWISSVIAILFLGKTEGALKVQCYLASWSLNNNANTSFRIADIIPTAGCDVIVYAFFKLVDNRFEPPDGNKFRGQFEQLNELKFKNPYLKIILSVGGWSYSANFSSTAGNDASRAALVGSVVRDLRKWGMDGLDVDWEFPEEKDKANYIALLKDLRYAFESDADATKRPRLELTAAVSNQVLPGYNAAEMQKYLDVVNVMTYDYNMHGLPGKENITGYNAGMDDVQASMKAWMAAGIPAQQLGMGLAFYARSWTLAESFIPSSLVVGQLTSGPGQAGSRSKEPGILLYTEYCPALNPGWTAQLNKSGQAVQARNNNQWINYDDSNTMKAKVLWAIEQKFNSVFVWHLAQDDVFSRCRTGRFPLLSAIAETINPGLVMVTTPFPTTVQTSETANTTTPVPWRPRSRSKASTARSASGAIVAVAATVSLLLASTGIAGTVSSYATKRPTYTRPTYTTTKSTTTTTRTTTVTETSKEIPTLVYIPVAVTEFPKEVIPVYIPAVTEVPKEVTTVAFNVTETVTAVNVTEMANNSINEAVSVSIPETVTVPVPIVESTIEPVMTSTENFSTDVTEALATVLPVSQPEDYDRPYEKVTESEQMATQKSVQNSTVVISTIKPARGCAPFIAISTSNVYFVVLTFAKIWCQILY